MRPEIETPAEYQGFPQMETAFDAGIEAAIPYIKKLEDVAQAADELMATLGADGEIDTLHPKTQILLDALYAWRPLFEEVSNVELTGGPPEK